MNSNIYKYGLRFGCADYMVHCSYLKVVFVHLQGSLNYNNGVVGKCYQLNTVFVVGLSLIGYKVCQDIVISCSRHTNSGTT